MTAAARKLELCDERERDERIDAARRLYCEVLGGREITSPTRRELRDTLRFVVGGVIIETGRERHDPRRVLLRLEDPEAFAARCWDAGFTVLVEQEQRSASPSTFGVVDPFGARLDLVGDDRSPLLELR